MDLPRGDPIPAAFSSEIRWFGIYVQFWRVAPVFRKKADSLQEIDAVQKGEAMITELQFLTPEELGQRRDRLENWSQICLDALPRLLS